MSKTQEMQRHMPFDYESEIEPQPKRKRPKMNMFLDAAIVAGILGIGVGAVDKGYIGTAVVHNPDGSTSVGVRYPNVPSTTEPLPELDASDRTTEVGILRRAARMQPWCSGAAINDKGTTYGACAKEASIMVDPNNPDGITADLRTDPESVNAPSLFVTFAANKPACTDALQGVQQSYKKSIENAGFDPLSAPPLRLIIDASVEAQVPEQGCADLCVPISSCAQIIQVPGTTETTNG